MHIATQTKEHVSILQLEENVIMSGGNEWQTIERFFSENQKKLFIYLAVHKNGNEVAHGSRGHE